MDNMFFENRSDEKREYFQKNAKQHDSLVLYDLRMIRLCGIKVMWDTRTGIGLGQLYDSNRISSDQRALLNE